MFIQRIRGIENSNKFRASLLLSFVTLGVAIAHSDDPKPTLSRFEFEDRCMGTSFKVTIYAPSEEAACAASGDALRKAHGLDDKFSDYKPNSELMQFCAKAGQGPIAVSDEFFEILQQAQEFARKSDGAFDVTVGPAVRLWRLARRTRELPLESEINDALKRISYQKLKLDPAKKTIELKTVGMKLDLGGIAKGYAADAMMKILKEAGLPRSLVTAGGDVLAGDAPPEMPGWKVVIEKIGSEPAITLTLKNAAVSTSGDAYQFVEIQGQRYAHIVNPKTGIGLTTRSTNTVIAKNSTTADALATAVAVLGTEQGMKLIDAEPNTACRVVTLINDKLEIHQTKTFQSWIQVPKKATSRINPRR